MLIGTVFQTLTTAYAAEICPMAIRGHLTSFVNICEPARIETNREEVKLIYRLGERVVHCCRCGASEYHDGQPMGMANPIHASMGLASTPLCVLPLRP